MPQGFSIAIDGPVGSGKGTLSVLLAKKLGILYLYTGGMWRALGLASIRSGIDLDNEELVLEVLMRSKIEPELNSGETRIFLDGEDVTEAIVQPEASNAASHVGRHPKVREEMVRRQQDIVRGKSAVIEGRDVASKVAPNAEIKIHLTADLQERARRRLNQYRERGMEKTFDEVLDEVKERDRKDMQRDASPLEVAEDSVVLDTTNDSIEDTTNRVIAILKEKELIND